MTSKIVDLTYPGKEGEMGVLRTRVAGVVALLLLALTVGLYLGGLLTLWLLRQPAPLHFTTYVEYWQALGQPDWQPFAGKIRLAGGLGFGLPLLSWAIVAVLILKPRARAFHGDARFAGRGDLARAGLLKPSPEGVIIGKAGGDYLYLGGTRHIVMTAPTRTGKTTSIAIPVLLTYRHSIVCMDLKGELFQHTSGYRAGIGQTIYRFAPYAEDGRTHRFNPLMAMSSDPRVRVGELQTLGAILYPDEPGQDPFWTSQSRTAFVAFGSYLFEAWDDKVRQNLHGSDGRPIDPNTHDAFPSFERIYRFSAGDDGELKAFLQARLKEPFVSTATRAALTSLTGMAEQTFASVIATTQAPLQQFLSPILAAATNACDFDVDVLRRRPVTIYVVIPPQKLGEARRLLNIFFSTVIGQNLRQTPQDDPALKYQMLLLMDEFTAMGRVNVLSERISLTAGYGIRDLSIIQSLSQLDATYGADEARTYITNHAASIVFTPREQRDAEEYSKMLGDTTVKRRTRSTGKQGTSYSHTEERRPLMLPQELKELPNDEEIIFLEGCRPIKCRKNWYFKDRRLKQRIVPPVAVRPISAAGEHPMPGKTRQAIAAAVSLALAACASPSISNAAAAESSAAVHAAPAIGVKAQHVPSTLSNGCRP